MLAEALWGRLNAPNAAKLTCQPSFTCCDQCDVTSAPRGSVRSTRGLGPTMTARGQSIGISIGMLPQTLIMSS